MIKKTLALLLGMAGFCDVTYGLLQGLDCHYIQYIDGTYHLVRGYIIFQLGAFMAKD
jgi:hypothetical protein